MTMQDEIQEMFEDHDKLTARKSKRQDLLVFSKRDLPKLGVTNTVSPAWELFRCRADQDRYKRFLRFIKACEMISSGLYSIRQVASETSYANNTVHSLLRKILAMRERKGMPDIKCPCGKPIIEHKGFCSYRFSKSEKRQDFFNNRLKRML